MKFRWPVKRGGRWRYLPVKEHPFYSEEQYSSAFTKGYGDFLEAIAKHIDPKEYDPKEKVDKIIGTLAGRVNERVPVVRAGNRKCREMKCPEGSLKWELYSTPNRDEYIDITINHLEEIMSEHHLDREAVLDKLAVIPVQIDDGRVISLRYVFENYRWLSSDPGATIDARWGIDKCGMIAGELKSARESIAFIRKRYSATDPAFAERSISTRQKIVDELIEERRKSACTTTNQAQ
jgi:hypothetical protein